MKTFSEWLAMREGLWRNDDNAVIGLSKLDPLPRDSAVNKSLSKRPAEAATPNVKPWKPNQSATLHPFKPTQPAKIVKQKVI